MEKMTNLKAVAYVLENCTLPADVREKMEKIQASFEKKATGERKPTATQVANEGLKGSILSYMAEQPNRLFTISELIKEVPELEGLSNQKVSALVTQMVGTSIKKIVEKRKSNFQYMG